MRRLFNFEPLGRDAYAIQSIGIRFLFNFKPLGFDWYSTQTVGMRRLFGFDAMPSSLQIIGARRVLYSLECEAYSISHHRNAMRIVFDGARFLFNFKQLECDAYCIQNVGIWRLFNFIPLRCDDYSSSNHRNAAPIQF